MDNLSKEGKNGQIRPLKKKMSIYSYAVTYSCCDYTFQTHYFCAYNQPYISHFSRKEGIKNLFIDLLRRHIAMKINKEIILLILISLEHW